MGSFGATFTDLTLLRAREQMQKNISYRSESKGKSSNFQWQKKERRGGGGYLSNSHISLSLSSLRLQPSRFLFRAKCASLFNLCHFHFSRVFFLKKSKGSEGKGRVIS
jgi:predicted SprT family Zn-dependent metalloprotease